MSEIINEKDLGQVSGLHAREAQVGKVRKRGKRAQVGKAGAGVEGDLGDLLALGEPLNGLVRNYAFLEADLGDLSASRHLVYGIGVDALVGNHGFQVTRGRT